MKRISSILLTLLLAFCVLFALPLNVGAASNGTQAGLDVTITTDRTEYTADNDIPISVNIRNNNSYKVEDVSVKTLLPDNLQLKNGNLCAADIDIEAGAYYSASVVTQLSKKLKDNDVIKLSNTTKIGNELKSDAPQTDYTFNILLWAVLLIAIIVGIVLVFKFKKTAKMMRLFLCLALVLTMMPMNAFATENDTATITVDKAITVDGKEYIITSTVKYSGISENDNAEDNQAVTTEIAELFDVDPDEYDSDNDGLSNYVEIYMTGTNPTLTDTDEDGVTDANEDADEDGLTNAEELALGTDLTKADSDGDGISDYKEINETNTDPCKYDTDEDGLSDGDELALGLNFLVQKTDGATLDSERKITQELNAGNIDELLIAEDSDAVPSLTLTTNGNVNNRIHITTSDSNDFSDSRAIVGDPIDVSGDNLGEGTIFFTLKNTASTFSVADTEGTFNTNLICKYNEDGTTEYLDTTFNTENNMVSANVDSEGTYFVLDVKNLFDELGLEMPTYTEKSTPVSTGSGAMAQADIVFLIDTTGSMRKEIDNVKDNVESFVDALKAKGVSAGLALIDYQDIYADGYDSTRVHKNGTSNWFYDMDAYKNAISALELGNGGDLPECAVDALETGRLLDMRPSAGKVFILVTDDGYKVDNRYGIPSMEAEIELLQNAGVNCAVVSPSDKQSIYYDLYNETNGAWADIYGDFHTELMTLADKIGNNIVGDGYWIYLEGPVPVPVRLDQKPTMGSTVDTDKDGIYDIDELDDITPTGSIDLDGLITRISNGIITGTDYGTVSTYKYNSNPVEADTDYDGTEDSKDNAPKNNKFKGVMYYENNEKQCDVEFTVNYRQFFYDNIVYYKDLSVLSMLYAADIYSGTYIEVTDGIKGGSDNTTDFAKLFGLEDVEDINITASEYQFDKDDLTEFLIGHRTVKYQGLKKEVIVLSVRGTNSTSEEWSSNFDVGANTTEYYSATGYNHPHWRNKGNHKGFDVAMNRILAKYNDYISRHNLDTISTQKAILVTGHSRGAAIANLLGAHFENDPAYSSYVYTFAAPYCTTDSNASSYKTIFNVMNSDDLIPYLPLSEWGFAKYGKVKMISVADMYEDSSAGGNQVGTFEWLIGSDYNNNGSVSSALSAFSKVADSREDLYVLDTSDDGKVNIGNKYHTTKKGAEKRLAEVQALMDEAKLSPFCVLSIKEAVGVKHVEVNYCPAYLMQNLANMASGVGPLTGYDTKGAYADAKTSFATCFIGGMTHPHMQPTYYLIARNNFATIK